MQRRSFLASIIALTAAPAVVRADSLMKIVVPRHVAEGHFITIYGYRLGEREQMEGRILRPSPEAAQAWSDALYREAAKKPLIADVRVVHGNVLLVNGRDGRYHSKFPKGIWRPQSLVVKGS